MATLARESLLSVIRVIGSDEYRHIQPMLVSPVIRDTSFDTSTKAKQYRPGWNVDEIFPDRAFQVIKTTSISETLKADKTQDTFSVLVDRYYIQDQGQICLIARRVRFVDTPFGGSLFLGNINGVLFERRRPMAMPLRGMSIGDNPAEYLVPSVFLRELADDWESFFKDGLRSKERDLYNRGLVYYAPSDINGLTGWKPIESLYLNMTRAATFLDMPDPDFDRGVSQSDILKRHTSFLVECLSHWLCESMHDRVVTNLPSFIYDVTFNKTRLSSDSVVRYIDPFTVTPDTRSHTLKNELLVDALKSVMEDIQNRDCTNDDTVTVRINRRYDDIVTVRLLGAKNEYGSFAFSLAKRMLLNYGVISSSIFTGRLSL